MGKKQLVGVLMKGGMCMRLDYGMKFWKYIWHSTFRNVEDRLIWKDMKDMKFLANHCILVWS